MADDNTQTRMQKMGYRAPADVPEPDQLVLVDYVSDGRIAVITLNRPHADNAVTTELAAQLIEVLETIAARTSVRVAILTGTGDRAFCVGGDLYERKEMSKEQWLRQRQVFDRVLYNLRQLRRPIFTAVNGMAYGGGCEMAISTDFIIASDDARFGQPEAMVGLSAGGGSPVFLPRMLPPGMAMQMLMTGEPITAREAHRLGMVNSLHHTRRTHDRSARHRREDRRQFTHSGPGGKACRSERTRRARRTSDRDHDGRTLALSRPHRPRSRNPCLHQKRGTRISRPRILSCGRKAGHPALGCKSLDHGRSAERGHSGRAGRGHRITPIDNPAPDAESTRTERPILAQQYHVADWWHGSRQVAIRG